MSLGTSSGTCQFPFQLCCSLPISGGKESVSLSPAKILHQHFNLFFYHIVQGNGELTKYATELQPFSITSSTQHNTRRTLVSSSIFQFKLTKITNIVFSFCIFSISPQVPPLRMIILGRHYLQGKSGFSPSYVSFCFFHFQTHRASSLL